MALAGRRLANVALAAAIFVLAAAVYLPVREHAWLNYDDDFLITHNPRIERPIDRESLRWAFTSIEHANWMPLTRLSWMLDRELHGLDAGGFLTTNLLLHALASALLFAALAKLTGQPAASAFVAAVFAVHPLHVESVAWASERRDVLSGVFWQLGLLAFAFAARGAHPRSAHAALFASFGLGLLAKPSVVTLPFVLLLLDAWPLGRLGRRGRGIAARALARAFVEKLPLFALSAAACWMTLRAQSAAGVVLALERLPVAERVGNALVAYVVYLRRFLWPSDLAVFYPLSGSGLPFWQPLGAGLLLLALTLLALRAWPRRGYLAVGWLWFLGVLVPMIGLVQVGSQALADRYMYLPLTGLAIALAWGVSDAVGRHARRRTAAACVALLVVGALAWTTRLQLRHWRDSVSLFEHALAVTEGNAVAHTQLGAAYSERGQIGLSIRHYWEAVRLRPDDVIALNNLAWLLATARDPSLRDPAFAVALAERAASLSPIPSPDVLDTLAAAYASAGRFDDAVRTLERALVWSDADAAPAPVKRLRERLGLYRAKRAYFE